MSKEEKEKENDLDPETDYDLSWSHPSDNEKRAHHNDLVRKMRVQITVLGLLERTHVCPR